MRINKRYHVFKTTPYTFVALGLLLCVCVGAAGGIVRTARAWSAQEKRPIYSVETARSETALGINCAWGNEDIPELLDILKRYKIKATFFIVGEWCDKFPDSVREIYAAGHEIGSHSDTHADMTKLDDAGILREIRDSRHKLQTVTGEPVKLFRVPSGAYNPHVIELIEQEGMVAIQWDCDSIDYKDPSPETMRERILKKLRKGSIMLFHSGAKNTPAALPLVIEAVRDKGFEFARVSDLLLPPPYVVDHEGRQRPAE